VGAGVSVGRGVSVGEDSGITGLHAAHRQTANKITNKRDTAAFPCSIAFIAFAAFGGQLDRCAQEAIFLPDTIFKKT